MKSFTINGNTLKEVKSMLLQLREALTNKSKKHLGEKS